jgi:UDP-N-acetylglucosamine---dolichyl-phosphate N-acetylglucosaminyltransferase
LTVDGDGQHDPTEIPFLVNTLLDNGLDIVIGYRPPGKNMPTLKKLGNQGIFFLEKTLFGANVVDTQSGFRAFMAKAWPKIKWDSDRYAVSSEIVKNIGQNRLRFKEVPIKTIYNDTYKGTSVLDGLKIGAHMLWWKIGGK